MTEAMYLLERAGGAEAQGELWGFLDDGLVVPHIPEAKEWERVLDVMKKYQDVPMDFADASLVVAAERLGLRRIFTIDSHFNIYRINGKDAFEVAP
jgi:predicted nucleic acid-binding protein